MEDRARQNLYREVDELELSVRSSTCLQDANLRFVGELVQKTESELLQIKNFTPKCLAEIRAMLGDMGLEIGTQLDDWTPPEQ